MPSFQRILFLFLFAACAFIVNAQQRIDTTQIYNIQEVVVKENKKVKELRSTTPLQILNADKLKQTGALQLSDAAKLFSGVVIKDYGGIGGLKTISVRSLGAPHTVISYDGIAITDAQTGQIDLGKLSLDNIDAISLNNGQSDNILQSARLFSAASILNLQTPSPTFTGKNINTQASIKAGSFGLINPNIYLANKWSKQISSSVSVDYMQAEGDYPYTNQNGNNPEKRNRDNSDIQSLKSEINIFGKFENNQKASLKIYYYDSERGLPTNILYNHTAAERLWDKNFFAQSTYENIINNKWSVSANAKFNWTYNKYINAIPANTQENRYYQNEYYLSATVLYRLSPNLSFSSANDGIINNIRANLNNFTYPTRYTLLNALAAKYVREQLTVTAHLLSTLTKETVEQGISADDRYRLSPSVSISLQPFKEEDLRIRLFYKDIFRLPTFNDLYYGNIGKRDLKPERVSEYNAGATWTRTSEKLFSNISLSLDAFYNRVNDKIVAFPNSTLFNWTMMNVGRVDIKGIETRLENTLSLTQKVNLQLTGSYTYQRALDKTDKHNRPDKVTYNHQIPYTPRHSGLISLSVTNPLVDISYTALFVGKRFALPYNSSENKLSGYQDHTLSLHREFSIKKYRLGAQFEVLNLWDNRYDIIRNYPMPGRQFRGSITFKY